MSTILPILQILLSIIGVALVVVILVYGRISAFRLRNEYAANDPRELSEQEREELSAWARRDIQFFILAMVSIVLFSIFSTFFSASPQVVIIAYLFFLGLLGVCLVHHFSARCPNCARAIGFQSSLGLPYTCEVCRVVFRPSYFGTLIRPQAARGYRYSSEKKFMGLPLIAVALGPDADTGKPYGVARGIIAVGDVAIGGLAVGGMSLGVLAIGGLSAGLFCLGGLAVGLVGLGGLAIGGLALGGLAIGYQALGGLAIGVYSLGGLAIGIHPQGGLVIPLPW